MTLIAPSGYEIGDWGLRIADLKTACGSRTASFPGQMTNEDCLSFFIGHWSFR